MLLPRRIQESVRECTSFSLSLLILLFAVRFGTRLLPFVVYASVIAKSHTRLGRARADLAVPSDQTQNMISMVIRPLKYLR